MFDLARKGSASKAHNVERRPGLDADANSPSLAATRPVRVLMVTARFLPDLGGTETHTYEMARRIALRSDIDLTVLTTDRSGARPTREEIDGFTVLRCRSYPRRRDYYFSPGVYRLVLAGDYDIVHCQGIHTAVPVLAMTAALSKRIPYIVTLHTGGHSSSLRHHLRNTQWRLLSPLLHQAADIVAVSRFEQKTFQRACALDSAHFRIIQNGGSLPNSGSPTEAIPGRIVSCGRLERYKGHHRVIDALPFIQQSIPNASLNILGCGPYEAQLRRRINALGLEDSVTIRYIDSADRKQIGESLGQASVAAALSEYESNPLAVMEALALSVPVVGLNAAGLGDLVEDGLITGIPRNASPETIAQTLLAVLQAKHERVVTKLPSWDDASADLAQVYLQAVRTTPERC